MLPCPSLPLHLYFVLCYNVSYRSSILYRQPVAMGPTLLQSLEEKDKPKIFKLGLIYMYYHVHCTFVGMYISDF